MSRVDKRWLVAGALLDAVGLALVVWSLPEGGMLLAAGAGLLLAGAWAISRAAAALSASAAPQAPPRHAAGDWTAEPELRVGEPRPVRLKFQPRMIAAIWMLTIAVAAGFAYERIWKLNPRPAGLEIVDSQGLDVWGAVHRKETRSGADGGARHYIYYNFQDQTGAELRSSTTVTRAIFDRFAEHDAIQVRYLAGDPSVHYLPEATRDPLARPVATALGVGMALVLILLEALRRRHRRLTAAGTVVEGRVESLRRRGATRVYQARYDVGGKSHRVRAQERNLRRREGDLVSVLVDPADPNSALVYAASIYRAIEPGAGESPAQRSRADSR